MYSWLVWVLVTTRDLQLASKSGLVALSPKVMGSDAKSRKTVSELNWIVGHPAGAGELEKSYWKRHYAFGVRQVVSKNQFRATYLHPLGFILNANHLNTVAFPELWFFANISLYRSLSFGGHIFQRTSTMWSWHIPFSSMSQVWTKYTIARCISYSELEFW